MERPAQYTEDEPQLERSRPSSLNQIVSPNRGAAFGLIVWSMTMVRRAFKSPSQATGTGVRAPSLSEAKGRKPGMRHRVQPTHFVDTSKWHFTEVPMTFSPSISARRSRAAR